jgi:hypothetical protein
MLTVALIGAALGFAGFARPARAASGPAAAARSRAMSASRMAALLARPIRVSSNAGGKPGDGGRGRRVVAAPSGFVLSHGAAGLQYAALPTLARASAPAGVERITSYAARITIQSDGSILVTEKITYDFGSDWRHGIFRVIPVRQRYNSSYDRMFPLAVRAIRSPDAPHQYTVQDDGSSVRIRIGDPNRTITGQHTYELSYRVRGGLTAVSDGDKLSWNAVGTEWNVPIDHATVQVSAPVAVTRAACFAGPLGSTHPCQRRHRRRDRALQPVRTRPARRPDRGGGNPAWRGRLGWPHSPRAVGLAASVRGDLGVGRRRGRAARGASGRRGRDTGLAPTVRPAPRASRPGGRRGAGPGDARVWPRSAADRARAARGPAARAGRHAAERCGHSPRCDRHDR